MPQIERKDNQNERIARSIILSNTNRIQRDSLSWIYEIEKAIVKALNAKDKSDAEVIAALRERLECSEPWRAAGFGPAAEVAELRHRIEKLERTVRYLCPDKSDDI